MAAIIRDSARHPDGTPAGSTASADPEVLPMDVFEAMETCRAMRWLKPDPVPEDLIRKVVYYATRASSPGNSQGWDFVVVRDPQKRKQIAELFQRDVKPLLVPWPANADGSTSLMAAGSDYLMEHFAEVPVL